MALVRCILGKFLGVFLISDFRRDLNIVYFLLGISQLQFDAGEIPRRKYTIFLGVVCHLYLEYVESSKTTECHVTYKKNVNKKS